MIDFENIQLVVARGLKNYCKCPVICSNQKKKPPSYPYISYTITTLAGENKGSYGVNEDGTESKSVPHIWSITAVSGNDIESMTIAYKAREWLDRVGSTYFNDNNVNLVSVGSVTNRDNFLTVEYEYRKGFDVFFSVNDVIGDTTEQDGYIETAEIGGINVDKPPTVEELNDMLSKRLDGEVR